MVLGLARELAGVASAPKSFNGAPDYEFGGQEFEFLRARQRNQTLNCKIARPNLPRKCVWADHGQMLTAESERCPAPSSHIKAIQPCMPKPAERATGRSRVDPRDQARRFSHSGAPRRQGRAATAKRSGSTSTASSICSAPGQRDHAAVLCAFDVLEFDRPQGSARGAARKSASTP